MKCQLTKFKKQLLQTVKKDSLKNIFWAKIFSKYKNFNLKGKISELSCNMSLFRIINLQLNTNHLFNCYTRIYNSKFFIVIIYFYSSTKTSICTLKYVH